jgi:tumor suppressor p53-binding protein 1
LFKLQDPEKEEPDDSMTNRLKKFATLPFVKEHLKNQIEAGGGKVYQHFEDIPKNKYKQCKLIAPHPCVTAKFVQCLAVDIPVS